MAGPLVGSPDRFARPGQRHRNPVTTLAPAAVRPLARRADPRAPTLTREPALSRYAAQIGFVLVAIWIAVIFVITTGLPS